MVYEFCLQLKKFPDFTISHIFQYALLRDHYTIVSTSTGGYNFKEKSRNEELFFAQKNNSAVRINCSRYLHTKTVKSVEIIEEYNVCLDTQFSHDTVYTDIFYSEKERRPIKKVNDNKYIIGKTGLTELIEGMDINDMILSQ